MPKPNNNNEKAAAVPKWLGPFCEFAASRGHARDAEATKRLFKADYAAFKQAEKEAKREDEAERGVKRKPDPVASSIGAAIKKMAMMSQEERAARARTIASDLKEKIEDAPTVLEAAPDLPSLLVGQVATALGAPPPPGGGGKKKTKAAADRAKAAFEKGADELGVPPRHPTRTAAMELYVCAVSKQ